MIRRSQPRRARAAVDDIKPVCDGVGHVYDSALRPRPAGRAPFWPSVAIYSQDRHMPLWFTADRATRSPRLAARSRRRVRHVRRGAGSGAVDQDLVASARLDGSSGWRRRLLVMAGLVRWSYRDCLSGRRQVSVEPRERDQRVVSRDVAACTSVKRIPRSWIGHDRPIRGRRSPVRTPPSRRLRSPGDDKLRLLALEWIQPDGGQASLEACDAM